MNKCSRLLWSSMVMIIITLMFQPSRSDPQINLLNKGCSQYNASNQINFFNNLNDTFADLKSQLTNGSNNHFATAEQARSSDPVYAMVQCRNYLSSADCVACYDAAVSQIRNCSAANGARVIYDGCFLRYESNSFYDQTTLPGNVQICSNRTVSQASAFDAVARTLLNDLELATPKINGYFAAVKRDVDGGTSSIYVVAQCAETISETGCADCLTVANGNIESCLPDGDGRAIDAACFLRYSDTSFFADNQTTNIASFLEGGSSSKNRYIIGGVVGGIGLLLIFLALLIWYQYSRKRKASPRGNVLGGTDLQGPVMYTYKDLKNATDNFSEQRKLGEGGFGEVYMGTLKSGNVVAVKKLSVNSSRVKTEFDSEIRLISNVHHRNVTRLLGCSMRGPDLLLVYEYMANGSLERYLYGDKQGSLNWKQRYRIIFGTARGLAYLHDQFHVRIIHRDIKSSNILLDDEFLPKIADFGLARLLPDDRTHLSTKFAGTLGYTAPEYALHGQLTEKVDTYSFGIVALEIVSGRRSGDMTIEPNAEYLLQQAWKLYESNMHLTLVDETIDPNEYTPEEVKRVIEVAISCTQSPPSLRPSMPEVVFMLSSEYPLDQRPPRRPTFMDQENRSPLETSTATADSSMSRATDTITDVTGR
ncbi:transmembrane signal receptor [Lithospermum erythrorhizon]|uniref:Transmembrane signal receptor n=1 Tax=Lithospermum erythrorhizon TaxID=34254 RepID=A0AAV3NZD4_LITER